LGSLHVSPFEIALDGVVTEPEESVSVEADQDTKENRQASQRLAQILGKLIALMLIVALVVAIQRYCQVAEVPFASHANIVVIDGDSLRADDGVEYRLFGIDAPELYQNCSEVNGKPWQCGRAAKVRLAAIINRGDANCEARAKDRFGRIVAVCRARGVPDISEAMVRDGFAIGLKFARGKYQQAQDEAEASKRGIWRGSFERPADWRAANPRVGN
jgi:endonuclease YncB( thermonuclease family)